MINVNILTLTGCFGRGLGFGGMPFFLAHRNRWHWSSQLVSSVKIMSPHDSDKRGWSRANCSLFIRLASRTVWQYAGLLNVQSKSCLALSIALVLRLTPKCSCRLFLSWSNVVSSLSCITESMCSIIAAVIFRGLRTPTSLEVTSFLIQYINLDSFMEI